MSEARAEHRPRGGADPGWRLARTILHVDMDAFYAAVEQRDHPELRGRPVVVGADACRGRGRGVVSTASYEARRFGIGSAMPISQAFRLCPTAAFLPVDMEKYGCVSDQLMEILGRFTDLVEPLSIDEAFLDVSGSRRAFGDGQAIAGRIKQALRAEVALTASIGVAACKLVAKIASDMQKPDGLVVVPPGSEAGFLAPLPIRRLWGVGPKTEERLIKAGLHTIGDLARCDADRLGRRLGTHGRDLVELAQGHDARPVIALVSQAKSVGHEHTFAVDVADSGRLRSSLLALADQVGRRLRQQGLRGRTVTLKYRDSAFRTATRAATLAHPTDCGTVLFEVAWRLLGEVHGTSKVRLVGVSVSGFEGAGQMALFSPEASRLDRLQDAVAKRFGVGAVTRASLLGRRGANGRPR